MAPAPIPKTLSALSAWILAKAPYQGIDHFTAEFPNVNDFLIRELEDAMLGAMGDLELGMNKLKEAIARHSIAHDSSQEPSQAATAAETLLSRLASTTITRLPRKEISKRVLAAKYQDSLTYQTRIIFIATSIQKLKTAARNLSRSPPPKPLLKRKDEPKDMLMGMLKTSPTPSSTSFSSGSLLSPPSPYPPSLVSPRFFSQQSRSSNMASGDEDDWFLVAAPRRNDSTLSISSTGLIAEQDRLYEEIELQLRGSGGGAGRMPLTPARRADGDESQGRRSR